MNSANATNPINSINPKNSIDQTNQTNASQMSENRSQRSVMRLNSAKDLDVYKKSYQLAMKIFKISKSFPAEEKFALTNQIRRSSRSVCLNLREAWLRTVRA